MSHQTASFVKLAVALALTAVACSSSSTSPGGSPLMRLEKGCLHTACDERQQSEGAQCGDCTAACNEASYNCDPSSACSASCSPPSDCTDREKSTCAEMGFKVDMPNDPSAELDAACKRMLAHFKECGHESAITEGDCTLFSETERPEMSTNYDCTAQLACDAKDTSSCDPATSGFGDQLCDSLEAVCAGTCDASTRSTLNWEGAWLRADVMAAASSCATQANCGDVGGCFSAWKSAVVR